MRRKQMRAVEAGKFRRLTGVTPAVLAQKQANRAINSRHLVVEHAIRHRKVFRLPGERNRRKRSGLRVNLIAASSNLQ